MGRAIWPEVRYRVERGSRHDSATTRDSVGGRRAQTSMGESCRRMAARSLGETELHPDLATIELWTWAAYMPCPPLLTLCADASPMGSGTRSLIRGYASTPSSCHIPLKPGNIAPATTCLVSTQHLSSQDR